MKSRLFSSFFKSPPTNKKEDHRLPSPLWQTSAVFAAAGMMVVTFQPLYAQIQNSDPVWWAERGVINTQTENNYAVANLGQAKHIATQAHAELETILPNGTGFALGSLFPSKPATANSEWYKNQRKALNLGQLKALAKPFYEKLNSISPAWVETQLNASGLTTEGIHYFQDADGGYYPWNDATPAAQNYAIANIGQVKAIFALHFREDTDADGLPDLYEYALISSDLTGTLATLADVTPNGDADGDGISNWNELVQQIIGSATPLPDQGTIPPLTNILNEHEPVGSVGGTFQVGSDGSAAYSIPIDLPAGTGGMAPQLALSYSSSGGNGVMGIGWGLSGLQGITRGPATKAKDGFIDPVDFDANDRFYLEGERLVSISGAYGADGTEYRTENNSFSRIISHGQLGSGPHYWTVETKAGLILQFGNCATSCVQNPTGDGAMVWSLNKAEDTLGNYYQVTYTQDGGGIGESIDYRPHSIRYTGNANANLAPYNLVKFIYQDRPDPSSGYVAGAKVHATKRMTGIEVRYDTSGTGNGTLLYSYNMSYLDENTTLYPNGWNDFIKESQTHSSLLDTITKTANGTTLPPTTIEWGEKYTHSEKSEWFDSTAENQQNRPTWGDTDGNVLSTFIDLNGDGLPDRVDHHNYESGGGPGMWVSLNTGSGFAQKRMWMNSVHISQNRPTSASDTLDTFSTFVDINGDGLPDRVEEGGVTGIWVRLNTGTSFEESFMWANFRAEPKKNRPTWGSSSGDIYSTFMDMNGDGLPDRVDNGGHSGIYVSLNTGTGFERSILWENYRGEEKKNRLTWGSHGETVYSTFIDINGDGLPDRVEGAGQEGIAVSLNNGAGFDDRVVWPNLRGSYKQNHPTYGNDTGDVFSTFLDVNADGLPDRVDQGGNAGIYVSLNTGSAGTGFEDPVLWPHPTSQYKQNRIEWEHDGYVTSTFMDINGDGLPDRVHHHNYAVGGGLWVSLNTGSAFGPLTKWMNTSTNIPIHRGGGNIYENFVDINGDGLPDRIDNDGDNRLSVSLNHGNGFDTQPNPTPTIQQRVTAITDGFGAEIKIQYQRLNDPTPLPGTTVPLYTPAAQSAMPAGQIALQGGGWVVSRYAEQDGLGGYRWKRNHYGDARFDRTHEQSLGFAWMKVIDEQRGQSSTTVYNQTYPFAGTILSNESRLADDTLISKSESRYIQKSATTPTATNGGTIRFIHADLTTSKQYDTDGTLLATTTTTTPSADLDAYGSALKTTVTLTDHINNTTWTTTTSNDYDNTTTGKWHLARLTGSTVTNTGTGLAPKTKTTSFTYHPTTGLLTSETVEPGHAKSVTTTRQHDAFGNVTTTTTTAAGMTSRTNTSEYGPRGRFVTKTTNPLNHSATSTYDHTRALLLTSTDANGLTISHQYDIFGTKILTTNPDGTQTADITKRYTGNEPDIVFIRKTQSSGTPPATAYLDAQGRTRITEATSFSGQTIRTLTEYDEKGRAHRVSTPHFAGTTPAGWQVTEYDELDRVLTVTHPDDTCDCGGYDKFTTTMTNRSQQLRTRHLNAKGQLIKVTDHLGQHTHFVYDANGNSLTATAPGNHIVSGTYDIFGQKLTTTDSDTGTSESTYDPYGQVLTAKDAKNQTVTFTYDDLGRPKTKTTPEETVTYTYDTAAGAALGKPHTVTSTTGYAEHYTYDDLGRTISTSRTIAGETYTGQTWYDALGRVILERDAGNLYIKHLYNTQGFETEIANAQTNETYWKPLEYDASGRLLRYQLGNGVTTNNTYNPLTGSLKRTQSGKNTTATGLLDMEYDWDTLGNLQWRKDHTLGLTENFTYDTLNRVKTSQVNAQPLKNYQYDVTGNITSKTDTGTYHYDNSTKPHRLTSITQTTGATVRNYQYDANGAILNDGRRTYTWTSFGKIKTIHQAAAPTVQTYAADSLWAAGDSHTSFDYDASGTRIRQTLTRTGEGANQGTAKRITTYIGTYEKEHHYTSTDTLSKTLHRHSIGGFLQIKKTNHSNAPPQSETNYFLKDHLGSTTAVLDENGTILERPSFDPWGKTRNATTWAATDPATQWLSSAHTNRGYTGHEQLDEIGLIHMNGRIYDPETARFLSPDPYVQEPENSQNFNRYAYVLNNPLSYTDPSGHFFKKLFKSIKRAFKSIGRAFSSAAKWVKNNWRTVVSIAFMAVLNYLLPGSGNLWLTMLKGGLSGAFNSAIHGGGIRDIIMGGLIGAAQAGLTNGLHKYGPTGPEASRNILKHVVGHGIVGGAANVAMGGKFKDGFISAAAGALTSWGPGGMRDYMDPEQAGQTGSNIFTRTAVAAIVGGTASVLGGGKFANGAYTAAFQHLFNAETEVLLGGENPQADKNWAAHKADVKSKILADGRLTRAEANSWYRIGGGEPLTVNGKLLTIDQYSTRQIKPLFGKAYNAHGGKAGKNIVKGFSDYSVHGKVGFKANGEIKSELYNFEHQPNARFLRNAQTFIGRASAGKGTPYMMHFSGKPKIIYHK